MPKKRVRATFRNEIVPLSLTSLVPSRELHPRERTHAKYHQIATSIESVGVIEAPVVFPLKNGKFRILDGHKRVDVLRAKQVPSVDCLIATEDEAYNYNKRVGYLSTVSEHLMILRALKHNNEKTIAQALDVSVPTIREKRDLLNGIAKEVVDLLKDRRVPPKAFRALRKMKPVRQIECAELMRASNMYSGRFAEALLRGTREDFLVQPEKKEQPDVLAPGQRRRMENETDAVLQNLRAVEKTYGTDVLTLTVGCRFVGRLLEDKQVHRYLSRKHSEILNELETIVLTVEEDAKLGAHKAS